MAFYIRNFQIIEFLVAAVDEDMGGL